MQSLNDGQASQDEAEIDALLAQMEVGDDQPASPPPGAQASAPEHKVDPHEKLDMSGMGEVDKLLDTLDIPPQPHERGQDAAQAAEPADLDNAVDDLLNAMSGSAPRKPDSEPAQEPDVHDLLAAASPQAEEPNFADDLDALLASADAPASAEVAAPAPQAQENPDLTADLDSLLAGLDAEQAQPAATESAPDEPAAAPAAPEPAPEKTPDLEMDLDALLASVDSPASARPTDRSDSGECDSCIDLDKLLAPASAPEAPASPASNLSVDQDNLPAGPDAEQNAAATAEPAQAQPASHPAAEDHTPEDVTPEAGPALETDLDALLAVYASARAYMCLHGNPSQWGDDYPSPALLEEDIRRGRLYVDTDERGAVHGAFAFLPGDDPTYARIEGGSWLSDAPYGVIHRVASDGRMPGVFRRCAAFCRARCANLRIDTHHDNHTMQRLIEGAGFRRCGVIYVEDGSPRIAYQYLKKTAGA